MYHMDMYHKIYFRKNSITYTTRCHLYKMSRKINNYTYISIHLYNSIIMNKNYFNPQLLDSECY